MEIHGSDFVVRSNIPIADNLIRFLIQDHWPKMVYEIDERPDATDMFVYRDEKAKEAWDGEGHSEENDEGMIYVIFDKTATEITLVIDDYKKNQHIVDDITEFTGKLNE
nr:hypothetical protein [Candidatus Dadabacteria bacterium]